MLCERRFTSNLFLRQSSPLRNFWVCRSSLKPDNFPELSLQGLHGRRRSFGLRLRAFTSLRHGFCLGLLRAVFWQLRWYSFSAWLVCELHTGLCPLRLGHGFLLHTGLCPLRLGHGFLLHAGLCPLLLGHGFSADFLLYGNFGDLSFFFATSSLRWRPRQHFSDFTARLCQHPRLQRKLK